MNKVYIASMLVCAGMITVSALEQPNMMVRTMYKSTSSIPMMREGVEIRSAMRGGESGQVTVSARAIPAEMMTPTTGDPVIDAQLKTLTVEMAAKMKSINDEYQAKVKALVGTRQLRFGGVMVASSTGMMRPVRAMRGIEVNSSQIRGSASLNKSSDNPGVFKMMRNDNEKVEGAQFNTMFRGMFGGDR